MWCSHWGAPPPPPGRPGVWTFRLRHRRQLQAPQGEVPSPDKGHLQKGPGRRGVSSGGQGWSRPGSGCVCGGGEDGAWTGSERGAQPGGPQGARPARLSPQVRRPLVAVLLSAPAPRQLSEPPEPPPLHQRAPAHGSPPARSPSPVCPRPSLLHSSALPPPVHAPRGRDPLAGPSATSLASAGLAHRPLRSRSLETGLSGLCHQGLGERAPTGKWAPSRTLMRSARDPRAEGRVGSSPPTGVPRSRAARPAEAGPPGAPRTLIQPLRGGLLGTPSDAGPAPPQPDVCSKGVLGPGPTHRLNSAGGGRASAGGLNLSANVFC